jgi:hypothetical protein
MRILTAATLLFAGTAFAEQDIQFVGKIQQPISPESQIHANARTFKGPLPTSVTLLKVKLSDHAWTKLQEKTHAEEQSQSIMASQESTTTGQNVQLGMNNVAVRDQGPHGTCATFANTAAIDAALNRGDYTSELCQLQLGRHLENNGYLVSGWDGSLGPWVLHQMEAFGVVSKKNQRANGCAGFTEYPTRDINEPETEMLLTDYHKISETISNGRVAWSPILDAYQVFIDKVNPEQTLQQVKTTLNEGDRLTFGVLLFNAHQGIAGAVGKYHVTNDTWILTPDIIQAINNQGEMGGHEMIITGYNDDAVAFDNQGNAHKGLLTLRSSWGAIGDNGDFYMSYDYFKTLTVEIQRIRSAG